MFVTLELLFPKYKIHMLEQHSVNWLQTGINKINRGLRRKFNFEKDPELQEICKSVVTEGLRHLKVLWDYFSDKYVISTHKICDFSDLTQVLKKLREIRVWSVDSMRMQTTHRANRALAALGAAEKALSEWSNY